MITLSDEETEKIRNSLKRMMAWNIAIPSDDPAHFISDYNMAKTALALLSSKLGDAS